MSDTIIAHCEAKGLRLTDQRGTIAREIGAADDHPDIEALQNRIAAKLGYRLKARRLELHGVPLKRD